MGKDKEEESKKESSRKNEAVPVEVMALTNGPIEEVLKLAVSLEAEEMVKVFSRSANRVAKLLVEEGDPVEKDQLLLQLEDDLQTIAVAKAENDYNKSNIEFIRQEPLYKEGLISEQAFIEIEFERKRAELSLKDSERELGYTQVKAPINGTITRRKVNLGDYVTPNQELFEMVDFNSIVAWVFHPEKYLNRLSVGKSARVIAPALGSKTFTAFVKRIAPIVESRTGTIKVTLAFPDVGELRPGMHVNTEIILDTYTNALLIPKQALVYDGDQTFAYRLGEDRKVEKLLVEPEMMDKYNITPPTASPFREGDQIVITGQTGLKDGAKVRLPGDPKPETESDSEEKSKDDSETESDETQETEKPPKKTARLQAGSLSC
jgi:membrane fusion protein (multidrug efflux system)